MSSKEDSEAQILGSVVVHEGRIRDYRELVNVVCSIVKKKEKTHEDVKIKEIMFFPQTRVYVAIYERPSWRMASQRRSEREADKTHG